MLNKINSNILRFGLKKNEWNSKYIEKQAEKLSFYVYNDLEIKKYQGLQTKISKYIQNDLALKKKIN